MYDRAHNILSDIFFMHTMYTLLCIYMQPTFTMFPALLTHLNAPIQVETDYGGYAWTQWMHEYFGDTALHIALKWKRHRAVKALLSLRPDWTIHNEAGITAEELVLRMYGKDMARFKDEQEREYENAAMLAEEEAMRR